MLPPKSKVMPVQLGFPLNSPGSPQMVRKVARRLKPMRLLAISDPYSGQDYWTDKKPATYSETFIGPYNAIFETLGVIIEPRYMFMETSIYTAPTSGHTINPLAYFAYAKCPIYSSNFCSINHVAKKPRIEAF